MEELELMDKEQKQEIVDAIKERKIYDFICSNSYRLNNDNLKDLLLECIAIIDKEYKYNELVENLKDFKLWEVK